MSSSWGNTINLTDTPNDMFGKVMSLRDDIMVKYFIHATQVSLARVQGIELALKKGDNPRDLKLELAEEIVKMYYGKEEALRAREGFISTFQKKEIPQEINEVGIKNEGEFLVDTLLSAGLISSKTDFRRLVDEGAIKKLFDNKEEKIIDSKVVTEKGIYKIGKRRFVKIVGDYTITN